MDCRTLADADRSAKTVRVTALTPASPDTDHSAPTECLLRRTRSVGRRLAATTLLPAALFFAERVDAQATAEDKAAAESLFDAGKHLLAQGKVPEACRKFEQSQAVDPGVGTLLYLGECYERDGRLASAWATFREAASSAETAGQADRARTAKERAQKLTPLLSHLTVEVPESARVPDLSIWLDGKQLLPALWSTPFPVDRGDHTIIVKAPGKLEATASMTMGTSKEEQRYVVPDLKDDPNAQKQATPAPSEAAASSSSAADVAPPSDGSTQRVIGLITGGVGLVGVGVGVGFGIHASSLDSKAGEACAADASGRCTGPDPQNFQGQAEDAATVAYVSYGVGGAALIAGAILYFTAPAGSGSDSATSRRAASQSASFRVVPLLGPEIAGMQVGGQF